MLDLSKVMYVVEQWRAIKSLISPLAEPNLDLEPNQYAKQEAVNFRKQGCD